MFKNLKRKILQEVIGELENLFEECDKKVKIKGFANQDNTLEIGIAMGVRKSIERIMDIKIEF